MLSPMQLNTEAVGAAAPGSPSWRPPPSPHANSGRRLSKTLMRADSQDLPGSKSWGIVELPGADGVRSRVRVVQKEEAEDANMLRVTWVWTHEGETSQVELRHGRKSGIRKVYVNKTLQQRVKSVRNLLSDVGSSHSFEAGRVAGEVVITPKPISGFVYQLRLNDMPIEQAVDGPAGTSSLDIGTRAVQLAKSEAGLGMTLRNNPLRTGVVVWTVEPGKCADMAGIMVGDVLLSIGDVILESIDSLLEQVAQAKEVVDLELAGPGPSRAVTITKAVDEYGRMDVPVGIGLVPTSCGVGLLVTDVDPQGAGARAGALLIAADTRTRPARRPASERLLPRRARAQDS